ncbi:hypothetical protein COOONC_16041 [Cooperia oncophora]
MPEDSTFLKDFRFLANVHQESQSDRNLETDMSVTLHEIHQELKAARDIDESWFHHLINTTCTDITGEELARRINRFLRSATTKVDKDKIVRLTQRYLLMDSVFLALTKSGQLSPGRREKWEQQNWTYEYKAEEVMILVDQEVRKLERNIDEMNYELNQATKSQEKEKTETPAQKDAVQSSSAQKSVHYSAASIQTTPIETRSVETQVQMGADVEARRSPQQKRSHSDDSEETATKVKVISDEDYLIQLIHESAEREDEEDTSEDENKKGKKHEVELPKTYRRTKVNTLEQDLKELEEGLRLLPKRRFGESSRGVNPNITCAFCGIRGVHYSDSCSELVHGDDRYHYIRRNRRCTYCLGFCDPYSRCKEEEKDCWYCNVVRGTVLRFLIPRDDGHHKALCTIPDSKDKIREAIQEVRDELDQARKQ